MTAMEQLSVIGFGTMGSGIAEYLGIHGSKVRVYELSTEVIDKNIVRVRESLQKLKEKGKIQDTPGEIEERISFSDDIPGCVRGSRIVIEAAFEDAKLKTEIAKRAMENTEKDVIICTNTSSIPVTYMQRHLPDPQRYAGLHWFNPPVLMKLIEIVKGDSTGMSSVEALRNFTDSIDKECIVAMKDVRGFIANRVFRALRYHAMILYSTGKLRKEQIDSALVFKFGLPMGVLALTDFTGGMKLEFDEAKSYDEIRREVPHYEPSVGYDKMYRRVRSIAAKLVEEGRTGVGAGRGIYQYPGPGQWKMPDLKALDGEDVSLPDLLAPMYNQGLHMVIGGVCRAEDIDRALKLGFGWKTGLFEYFENEDTKKQVSGILEKYARTFPDLEEFYSYAR